MVLSKREYSWLMAITGFFTHTNLDGSLNIVLGYIDCHGLLSRIEFNFAPMWFCTSMCDVLYFWGIKYGQLWICYQENKISGTQNYTYYQLNKGRSIARQYFNISIQLIAF